MTELTVSLPEMVPAEHHSSARHLKPGVYTPLPTFFDKDQELNLEEYEKHLIRKCSLCRIFRSVYTCADNIDVVSKGTCTCRMEQAIATT